MSKPRPGVAASKRLANCKDESIWIKVENQYDDVKSFLKEGFETIERNYERIARNMKKSGDEKSFTKDDLMDVVAWKFAVGKPRHALMKYLHSNTEDSVRENFDKALEDFEHDGKIDLCIKEFTKLKGVGPATASALFTLVNPYSFVYMYDEVIDCFLPKRNYTLPTYLSMNWECMEIAMSLGEEWSAARVAKVLWIAARANAYDLEDHTLQINNKLPIVSKENVKNGGNTRARKRQKR